MYGLTASVGVVGPVGKWSGAWRPSTPPQGIAWLRRSGSRSLAGLGVAGLAVAAVVGEASVEDGEGVVGVFVDPNPDLNVVVTVGRELQAASLVARGVVVGDGAVLVGGCRSRRQ